MAVLAVTERSWARDPAADQQTRDEQLVKALSYGMLPAGEVLELLEEARGHHAEKLAYYEELEGGLEARLREDKISKEAYIGTLLVLRRGISGERCYAEWCEEAMALVSSAEELRVDAPYKG
jgi:virulence activator alpha